MKFTLDNNNCITFQMKQYSPEKYEGLRKFDSDMRKFSSINRLFRIQKSNKYLHFLRLINLIQITHNIFGRGTVPLLFLKTKPEHYPELKTILVFCEILDPNEIIGCLENMEVGLIPTDSKLLDYLKSTFR